MRKHGLKPRSTSFCATDINLTLALGAVVPQEFPNVVRTGIQSRLYVALDGRMRKISVLPKSFKVMQVLSDLQSAAAASFDALAARTSPALQDTLSRVVFDQDCKMTPQDAEALHAELMMIASMPDQDHPSFVTATIVLLTDRLRRGAGQDDLFWNWDAFQERFRQAPSPIRAALMNGFRCADDMQLVKLDQPPSGTDLRTYDEEDLIRLLRIIARSMTDNARDEVCMIAPEEIRDVHRTALENCLRTSCILSEFGSWFPYEVVEPVSLDTEHPAYAACSALILLDAIVTSDAEGKMAYRYEELAEEFFHLKPEYRMPMVAGLRHLHEMEADWEPYAEWPPEELMQKAIVMPFAKP